MIRILFQLGSIYDKRLDDFAFNIIPISRDTKKTRVKRSCNASWQNKINNYQHLLIPKTSSVSRHLNVDSIKFDRGNLFVFFFSKQTLLVLFSAAIFLSDASKAQN